MRILILVVNSLTNSSTLEIFILNKILWSFYFSHLYYWTFLCLCFLCLVMAPRNFAFGTYNVALLILMQPRVSLKIYKKDKQNKKIKIKECQTFFVNSISDKVWDKKSHFAGWMIDLIALLSKPCFLHLFKRI